MLAAEVQESGMVRHESIVFDRDRADPGPIRVVNGQSGCSSGLRLVTDHLPAAGGLRAAPVAPGRAYKSSSVTSIRAVPGVFGPLQLAGSRAFNYIFPPRAAENLARPTCMHIRGCPVSQHREAHISSRVAGARHSRTHGINCS
jgi:hypothetical protein